MSEKDLDIPQINYLKASTIYNYNNNEKINHLGNNLLSFERKTPKFCHLSHKSSQVSNANLQGLNNKSLESNPTNQNNNITNTNISISIVNPNISIQKNKSNINTINTGFRSHFTFNHNEDSNDNDNTLEVSNNEHILNQFFSDIVTHNDNIPTNNPNKVQNSDYLNSLNSIPFQNFINHTKNHQLTTFPQKTGIIQGFSAYTYKNQKTYNEDKMGININFSIDNHLVSFYGIYDGHGGQDAANMLKDNLHEEILGTKLIISNPPDAIFTGFKNIEKKITSKFLHDNTNIHTKMISSSGSCALLLVIIEQKIHIGNLGDSRGIISINKGNEIYSLTIDHKANEEKEKIRVLANGGEIRPSSLGGNNSPARIFPGGLAVTRSIGDIESKLPQYGGKVGVIESIPDIISFNYKKNFDFILLGCDGIYDKLSNKEIGLIVYSTLKECVERKKNFEHFLQKVIINIMKEAISKGSRDNLSCIFLCCDTIKEMLIKKDIVQINKSINVITNLNDTNILYKDYTNAFFLSLSKKNISRVRTGLDLLHKSTLNYNNIQFDYSRLSYKRSNMSIDANTSNIDKNNKKKQTNNKKGWCCGLFV